MQLDSEVLRGLIKIQNSIYSQQFTHSELLDLICYHAMSLTRATGSVIEYIQNGQIEYHSTAGACDLYRGIVFPAENSLSHICFTGKKAMLCTDAENDDRVNKEQCRRVGVVSMALVPLVSRNRIMGVLKVISDQKNGFDEKTVEALTLISGFLATSLLKAEVEEEREITIAVVEEQLRFRDSITALVPNNIYIYDIKNKNYIYVNDSFKEFLGLSMEQMDAMGEQFFKEIIHPDDHEFLAQHFHQYELPSKDEIIEFEIRSKHVSGHWRWMRIRESVFKKNEAGETMQIIGIATDVTSLHDQNAELERRIAIRTAQLNSLSEKIPNLVWHTDNLGNGIYVNQRWIEYTGKPLGSDFSKMIHPDDLESCMKTWGEALASKQDFQTEYRLRSKDGDYRWFFVRGVPTLGPNDEVTEWYGTCTDIHDKKMVLETIHQAKVNEDAAKEASKLKSEFLANMSHEIRTPLNGVIGVTGLLAQTQLDGKQKEYVDIIRSSGELLLTLLNDILDLSKIEAGKLEFETIDFPLRESIEDVKKALDYMAEKKGLKLRSDISDSLPRRVSGDPDRLKQILFNLVSNAIKFTERGVVSIVCHEVSRRAGRVRLRFEIKDTGIGIKKEAMDKMFKAFSQADASTQRRFGGTGLGLSICKNLVERMNGEIGVESQENKGSNFWFEIDLELEKEAELNPKMAEPQAAQMILASPIKTRSARILIAEDNSVNQLITTTMIENLGLEVDVVKNGFEALKAIENEYYDVILMDCHMPGVDGYEATRQIRRSPKSKNQKLRIIAMTANAMVGDADKCFAVGMDDHLAKPISFEDLTHRLEFWLQHKTEAR